MMGKMRAYHEQDGAPLDQVTLKALPDDPFRRVDIECGEHLCRGMREAAVMNRFKLTSSRRRIFAEEYTARANVIRA